MQSIPCCKDWISKVCCSAWNMATLNYIKQTPLNWIMWSLISNPWNLIHDMFWWKSILKIFFLKNIWMAPGTRCLYAIRNYMRKVTLKYQHVIGRINKLQQPIWSSCDYLLHHYSIYKDCLNPLVRLFVEEYPLRIIMFVCLYMGTEIMWILILSFKYQLYSYM